MKQIRNYSLLAGAVLTLALTSCNNNEIETIPYEGPVAAQVSAGINGVTTRATDAAWANGDAIGISCSSDGNVTKYDNMKYVTASGNGTFTHYTSDSEDLANGIFFQGTGQVTFSAYYPFTETEGSPAGTIESVTTEDQTKQKSFDYLYATGATAVYSDPAVSFTNTAIFKHKMTRLILIIKTSESDGFEAGDVASGAYSISGIKHSGKFDTATGTAEATGSTTDDWAITATATDQSNERTYSMILYPQGGTPSLTFKATIKNQDYTATITPALAASTSYTYTITVKKSGLTVSSCTIEGWGAEQTGDGEATMK